MTGGTIPMVVFAMLIALTAAGAAPAGAAGEADAAKGIVVEHCVGCHAVPGYSAQGLPTVEAPSFQAIADDPGTYTDSRLRGFLLRPHWPMVQFRLSPSDIDNLVAFIARLRRG